MIAYGFVMGLEVHGFYDRWYDKFRPVADALYDEHLESLKKEGLI